MNIDIEFDENLVKIYLQEAADAYIKKEINAKINYWGLSTFIKKRVDALYDERVDELIREELSKRGELEVEIRKGIVSKLRSNINKLIKESVGE